MGHSIIQTDGMTVEVRGKRVYINNCPVQPDTIEQIRFTKISNMVCVIGGFLAGGFCAYVLLPELIQMGLR
jgi:hypothetical protein